LYECNSEACKECVHHISAIVECDFMLHIRKPFSARRVIDGSTDIPEEEQVICVCVTKGVVN
jgi:hypothetical protein